MATIRHLVNDVAAALPFFYTALGFVEAQSPDQIQADRL